MDVITTVPNVSYKVYTTKGEEIDVHNPSGLPAVNYIDRIEEPYIVAQLITKAEYVGAIMNLCIDKRGTLKNQVYLTSDRVELTFEMPLSEIVFDFYDKLKSISKGYASFDYYYTSYQKADLVRLDILLNGEMVDALSTLIYRGHAYDFGRKICEKLKELIRGSSLTLQSRLQSGPRLYRGRLSRLSERMSRRNAMAATLPGSASFLRSRRRERRGCGR